MKRGLGGFSDTARRNLLWKPYLGTQLGGSAKLIKQDGDESIYTMLSSMARISSSDRASSQGLHCQRLLLLTHAKRKSRSPNYSTSQLNHGPSPWKSVASAAATNSLLPLLSLSSSSSATAANAGAPPALRSAFRLSSRTSTSQ